MTELALVGRTLPTLRLPATTGPDVELSDLPPGRTVLYVYPKTGRPGEPLPDGWEDVPGALGCTPEACAFRDHHGDLSATGAVVLGLSSQTTEYQREAAQRLQLQFPLLSDPTLSLAAALDLPTFELGGERFYQRQTLVARDQVIEHVFYPVSPPAGHAGQVLDWLRANPA